MYMRISIITWASVTIADRTLASDNLFNISPTSSPLNDSFIIIKSETKRSYKKGCTFLHLEDFHMVEDTYKDALTMGLPRATRSLAFNCCRRRYQTGCCPDTISDSIPRVWLEVLIMGAVSILVLCLSNRNDCKRWEDSLDE